MTMKIAVFNQAGGVGKTSLTRDLGYELQTRNLNVLIIDADSQGSLSEFLGTEPFQRPDEEMFWWSVIQFEKEGGTFDPFLLEVFGMDIGMANFSLIEHEEYLAVKDVQSLFLDAIEALPKHYDVILVDCPPAIHEIAKQVLFCVDEILIPVQTEHKAFVGLAIVQREITKANKRRKRLNKPLRIAGIVPTIYNENRNVHSFYLEKISEFAKTGLRSHCFLPVRDFIAVTEASNAKKPLKLYSPKCPVNEDIQKIADFLTTQLTKE